MSRLIYGAATLLNVGKADLGPGCLHTPNTMFSAEAQSFQEPYIVNIAATKLVEFLASQIRTHPNGQ